ncbi:uroporphyrinogen-III synthase [Moraxella cuniculi DSM 21768]|uniref:Uroporphyrinogen-III synthase n=1 Tax=Moraxella cuniculi DSM 21768 TaxID=1122245 RepID=A0A1N7DX23_9GAMM|nr:uroporphyrinogen-III synthase [Moraxella cuniculi]OOS07380.1 hypothetical protein B0189_02835 [Moraxella cuniculi]SIR80225.1 uroporphyrinogen-III synthase [Moraxella cuniculi DSM 21768]
MTPLLINTRPSHRSAAIDQITAVPVVSLPLLEIVSLSLSISEQAMMTKWLTGDYHALVITSVEAAKRALAYLGQLGVDLTTVATTMTAPIIAVGEATAKVLSARGFSVILPAVASNEGMLALPEIATLQASERVLIWCGVGGRRLLKDTLLAKGVQVDDVYWYQRRVPDNLELQFNHLQPLLDKHNTCVLISSQMAYQAWRTLQHTCRYYYLTLGERLSQLVRSQEPAAQVAKIDTLHPDEICLAIDGLMQHTA